MIVEVPVKTCDICGSTRTIEECARTPRYQTIELAVGQEVALYWMRGGFRTVRTARPERYSVMALRYKGPGYHNSPMFTSEAHPLPLHSLVITVGQNFDGTPWTEKSSGYSFVSLSEEQFLLWQEGDIKKLQDAGFLSRPSWLRRLLRRS